jgi:hypothetical protein
VSSRCLLPSWFFWPPCGRPPSSSPIRTSRRRCEPGLCQARHSGALVEADVAQVSTVIARNRGIRSLSGLEKCRSLAMLDVAGNAVSDVQPRPACRGCSFWISRATGHKPGALATVPPPVSAGGTKPGERRDAAGGLTNLAALISAATASRTRPLLALRRLNSLISRTTASDRSRVWADSADFRASP